MTNSKSEFVFQMYFCLMYFCWCIFVWISTECLFIQREMLQIFTSIHHSTPYQTSHALIEVVHPVYFCFYGVNWNLLNTPSLFRFHTLIEVVHSIYFLLLWNKFKSTATSLPSPVSHFVYRSCSIHSFFLLPHGRVNCQLIIRFICED